MTEMRDSNVGMGMVPHKKSCRCDECEIERLRHEIDVQCSSEYVERILKENERLRAALMRIESNIGFSKTFLQKIAREALK